jgi:hypothetical protein
VPQGNATEKIDPRLLALPPGEEIDFLLVLGEQADLSQAAEVRDPKERRRFVYERLRAAAASTQAPMLERLRARGLDARPLWIANLVHVRGPRPDLAALASPPEVRRLEANPYIVLERPWAVQRGQVATATSGIEWNVLQIGADLAWGLGYDGTGVVIGGQDTGYAWTHPAIRSAYRGWNGVSATHAYNWHDAIHSGGGVCGAS